MDNKYLKIKLPFRPEKTFGSFDGSSEQSTQYPLLKNKPEIFADEYIPKEEPDNKYKKLLKNK